MDMCGNCLDEFDFLPYQYSVLTRDPTNVTVDGKRLTSTTVEVKEEFCCFLCMKFWFEDESIEDWREKR